MIPTSNHNYLQYWNFFCLLYIFWFLHQTTTAAHSLLFYLCCISFDSYIKPQQLDLAQLWLYGCISFDSYIKPQLVKNSTNNRPVVYLLIPTSNHNAWAKVCWMDKLYIFWFLHQTTTMQTFPTTSISCISFDSYIKPQRCGCNRKSRECCISFDSYIKPQPELVPVEDDTVVYLLIPTSNHNHKLTCKLLVQLYIFWFLHQTTTSCIQCRLAAQLYIFWFLHQTTTHVWW